MTNIKIIYTKVRAKEDFHVDLMNTVSKQVESVTIEEGANLYCVKYEDGSELYLAVVGEKLVPIINGGKVC